MSERGPLAWFTGSKVPANLLMLFLLLGGLIAIGSMRAEIFPNIDPRLVTVSVPWPGATPGEVESGITTRVEEAVIGIDGVKRVTSTARANLGLVQVEVAEYASVDDVHNRVETEVDSLVEFPPAGAENPAVMKQQPTPSVMKLVLHGDVDPLLLKQWAQQLEEDLLREAAVSLVQVQATKAYQLAIEVDEDSLRRHQLSLADVAERVRAFSRDIPAGVLETPAGDILLRVENKGDVAADFEPMVIRAQPDGSLLRLGDIARISDRFAATDINARYNGEPAVFIRIARSSAQDTLRVERRVQDLLRDYPLPAGVELALWESDTDILRGRMNLLLRNAVLGFALVLMLLLLFLDLKLAFWTAMGVPIAFCGGLLIAFMLGQSINMITLFALIVVLGIVVDDAIVVGESIFARHEAGDTDVRAAVGGVKDVMTPVSVGIATTIAAFMPLLFMSGNLGQMLRHIPVIVIAILVVSLIEAYLILPAHLSSSRRWSRGVMVRIHDASADALARFRQRVLLPAVQWSLRWRYAVLALSLTLPLSAYVLFAGDWMRFVFFPQIEGDTVTAELAMPVGTSYAVTRRQAQRIEAAARQTAGHFTPDAVRGVFTLTGGTLRESSPGSAGGVERAGYRAQVRVKLAPARTRAFAAADFARRWREAVGGVPGAEQLRFDTGLVNAGADIYFQLAHDDPRALAAGARQLKAALRSIDGVQDVADDLLLGQREFIFELTPAGLAAGLTPAMLGQQLRGAFYGHEVQRIQRRHAEVRVLVSYPRQRRESRAHLADFRLQLPNGERAALHTVARIVERSGPAAIHRADGHRVSAVTADVDPDVIAPAAVMARIQAQTLPRLAKTLPDLAVAVEGEAKDRRRDLRALGRNMVIAALAIFVLLGSLLRSYVQPLIIMAAIPFGAVGALWGHGLLGFNLSFISLFGIVALAGVVVNDTVVLMDYYNRRRDDGEPVSEALLAAVKRRFRPILLTTLTTCCSLLPLLFESSLQARFLIPMAVSLAFGLLLSTPVMLLLVPALVAIVEDVRRRGAALLARQP